jgi:alkane 1-monooxygenase
MTMDKFKYLAITILPISVAIAFLNNGILAYATMFVFFIIVPVLELIIPPDQTNKEGDDREKAVNDKFYDILLYLMVPVQFGFLFWFLAILQDEVSVVTMIGRVVSMGLMCGIVGINVGHELGHRFNKFENLCGDLLMLTSLENHFVPYHNRGHHNNVATPEDPATARMSEPLYLFWFRSHIGSYKQAWQIEIARMKIMKKRILSFDNKMVKYTIAQIVFVGLIAFLFGLKGVLFFIIVATIGIGLLETVNYIEHYGLIRIKNEKGRYERVKRKHSWNSDHVLGRAILFELSRHSDHHFKADRPYQILESREESPAMPTGYPGMMIMALVPPLFFAVMNPRVVTAREI